jgi:putative Ca2+/H+ antiporter (TMEM165/GDT1 family)
LALNSQSASNRFHAQVVFVGASRGSNIISLAAIVLGGWINVRLARDTASVAKIFGKAHLSLLGAIGIYQR